MCHVCNSRMREVSGTASGRWGKYQVTIQGVNQYVCANCNEIVYDSHEASLIESISRAFAEQGSRSPDLLNVEEVAEYLRVSAQTVYNMIKDGRLRATKCGREWRFRKKDVVDLLGQPEDKGGTSGANR